MGDAVGKCRHSDNIRLPCNWVVGGRCGADGSVCDIKVIQSV